jgi:lysophospholipase L1-like esterase
VAVPVLARELSDDGGHLNERGRQAVAQAFADYLARA